MRKEKLEELKYYIEELKTIKSVSTNGTFLKSEAYEFTLSNGFVIKREKLINNGEFLPSYMWNVNGWLASKVIMTVVR